MYVTPSGKMGSCSWGMADLARHERQNTAYPPQTAHSQNPSDSSKCRPPNRLSLLCKILIRQLICPPWALQPSPKTSGVLKEGDEALSLDDADDEADAAEPCEVPPTDDRLADVFTAVDAAIAQTNRTLVANSTSQDRRP